MSLNASTLALLRETFPKQLEIDTADLATLIHSTPDSIRTRRSRGDFHIPSHQGSDRGHHMYDLRDVAEYIDQCRGAKTKKASVGRPTKIEQRAAEKAGLTVAEYRQRQEGGQ